MSGKIKYFRIKLNGVQEKRLFNLEGVIQHRENSTLLILDDQKELDFDEFISIPEIKSAILELPNIPQDLFELFSRESPKNTHIRTSLLSPLTGLFNISDNESDPEDPVQTSTPINNQSRIKSLFSQLGKPKDKISPIKPGNSSAERSDYLTTDSIDNTKIGNTIEMTGDNKDSKDENKVILKLSELFSFVDNFDGKPESYEFFKRHANAHIIWQTIDQNPHS